MYSHCNNGLKSSHSLNSTLWLVCLLHNLKPNPVNESPSTLWTMFSSPGSRQGFDWRAWFYCGQSWIWVWGDLALAVVEVKKKHEKITRVDWDQTLWYLRNISHKNPAPDLTVYLVTGQTTYSVQLPMVRRIWYLLDTNFPLWLGCSQASRAFLNVIGLLIKAYMDICMYISWSLNVPTCTSHILAVPTERGSIPPHLAVEWTRQVQCSPPKHQYFVCLVVHSITNDRLKLVIWQVRGYSNYKNFFSI